VAALSTLARYHDGTFMAPRDGMVGIVGRELIVVWFRITFTPIIYSQVSNLDFGRDTYVISHILSLAGVSS
jgi:hypothetical protein